MIGRSGWAVLPAIPEARQKRGRRASKHRTLDPHRAAHRAQSELIERRIEDALLEEQTADGWEE